MSVETVFLIHGRNLGCMNDLRELLEMSGLEVHTFEDVESKLKDGAPFIGKVVEEGVANSDAVVALFTPDELASLHPQFRQEHDKQSNEVRYQARPNVIFEAGLAFGLKAGRSLLVTIGSDTDLFSDVRGRLIRRLDNRVGSKAELLDALSNIGAELNPVAVEKAVHRPCPEFDRVLTELKTHRLRDPFGYVGGDDWAFAGTVVVVDDTDHFLLVEHMHHNVLLPPGGRATGGRMPHEVALLKALEETGY